MKECIGRVLKKKKREIYRRDKQDQEKVITIIGNWILMAI